MSRKADAPGKIPLPNFLLIGAMKSGTTSLHHYLSQHPQIYMSPRKEPRFFAFENTPRGEFPTPNGESKPIIGKTVRHPKEYQISNLDDYQKLFKNVKSEIAIGEASPIYMFLPQTAENIFRHIPHAKIIAILRNPVDRAYSNFKHLRRDGRERISDFAAALREENKRLKEKWLPEWLYKQRGFYYGQLKRFYDRFDRRQIKIYIFDAFCSNPLAIVRDIFLFLGVNDSFVPDVTKKHNAGNEPVLRFKWGIIDDLFNRPNILKSAVKRFVPAEILQKTKYLMSTYNLPGGKIMQFPPMDENVRRQLQNEYKDDILKLQKLIDTDLSLWLK